LLGFFALELIVAGMVRPGRTLRSFELLWLFVRADRCAHQLLDPLLIGTPPRRSELIRYARNCIVLVALQPERAGAAIRISSDWVLPAALFGACIPLYDGCVDQLPTRTARQFGRAVAEAFAETSAEAEPQGLRPLAGLLSQYGSSPEDGACWEALLNGLGAWMARQQPSRRLLILGWMERMNEAEIASLGERNVTLSTGERRRLSAQKGGVSFLLLRSLCIPQELDKARSETTRAALLQAAALAQWIDDYADVSDDRRLGIHTYIGRLEASHKATDTIRAGICDTAIALRSVYGRSSEHFIDSLRLYFAVKRCQRLNGRLALNLAASDRSTRPGHGPGASPPWAQAPGFRQPGEGPGGGHPAAARAQPPDWP
jgi:hypothetical protein